MGVRSGLVKVQTSWKSYTSDFVNMIVLGVNKSTCTNMVYDELGATPLSLISQSRMVMFWARIKQVEENPKISSSLFQYVT